MNTQEFSYPPKALLHDYVRSVIGFTCFGFTALFVETSSVMFWVLGGFALLFAAFAVRTAIRQHSRIVVDDTGVRSVGPLGRAIGWDEIGSVRIKFYSTWRDRSSGWMQLVITGGRGSIRVDQPIRDFETLSGLICHKVLLTGLTLDATTRQNAGAMGLHIPATRGDEYS